MMMADLMQSTYIDDERVIRVETDVEPDATPVTIPTTATALMETLAAIEHERWADWQAHVHGFDDPDDRPSDSGAVVLPGYIVQQWQRQIETLYAELSDDEKQSDREQVMRYWPIFVEFAARWIGDNAGFAHAQAWRRKMTPVTDN